MKIGILTFHRAHNYGAMLQAYALKHILQGKGHHVEFLSYCQPKIESAYKAFICNISRSNGIIGNVKNVLSAVITLNRRMERRRRFVQFMEKNKCHRYAEHIFTVAGDSGFGRCPDS